MSATTADQCTLVTSLATLLRNSGDSVLDGSSTLTLEACHLQPLTRLFEQHLLSRTHQHGFLALPSHPADTPTLLQLQFLFDMLQKTLSLKLINPPGARLQSVVKIYPFKSLKHLELKRIPPHCLEGLRGVYSQLEMFTCSRSLSSLEELLSLCGGDLSSALPWLELQTLNFSYNTIQCLDDSLPLSELEHLNLAYNHLQRAPLLGLHARARLRMLILRNNELENINGIEVLGSLQHLDLAYNLLLEHLQLAPLSQLHQLNKLILEGNPLYFQKTHRLSSILHLSPRVAFKQFQLDYCLLSSSELAALPRSGQLIGKMDQALAPPPVVPAAEPGPLDASSGAELTDSLSVGEAGAHLRRNKSKGKVKVRRASISEPSDTDHEPRVGSLLGEIILHHQKDIERMDTFRDQLGEDWLRYQHHLEPMFTPSISTPTPAEMTSKPLTKGHCTSPQTAPLLMSEPVDKFTEVDMESTLQWVGHAQKPLTESTLDSNVQEAVTYAQNEEEEEIGGVDLCLPLLVGVLADRDEGKSSTSSDMPVFLRVRHSLLLEVDMQKGHIKNRQELDSLQEVVTTQAQWGEEDSQILPTLELRFRYIIRERRRRRYVMLDEDPQQALQTLSEVLSHVAEENQQRLEEEDRLQEIRFQCLRCGTERERPREIGVQGENWNESSRQDAMGSILICLECNSDHVVQVPGMTMPSTSTPVHETVLPEAYSVMTCEGLSSLAQEVGNSFLSVPTGLSCSGREEGSETQSVTFHTAHKDTGTFKDLDEIGVCSYTLPKPEPQHPPPEGISPAHFDLLLEDFDAVDHRLKLFLDVEVFEGNEDLHSFLKMSTVRFGDPEEFPSLLVVSDQCIYILEIISESHKGQPSDCFRKRYSHRLCELSCLQVGLGSQTINMEFEDGGAAYTLLVRDSVRCKRFFSLFTELVRELAPQSESKLKSISTTRLTPQHHLWPLLCEDAQMTEDSEKCQPQFLYLLAFLWQDCSLSPVTVLATLETLYLLYEDHQWSRSLSSPAACQEERAGKGRFTVYQSQPISCISSVHLFSSSQCQVEIKLYDEVVQEERMWALQTESPELLQGLVDWIRGQWETMFGVKLTTIVQ
ncbi:serine/threonine-protein kinase 11-interacting protein isoform X2 [Denticeps clupeoides]|uniref:Serine/threonine-protein kinase 11-interacting protein n=1 Tax=Denticeps clupeoides TaxID=299321 RepID=A0AAY4B2U2_9TELE|nr:serine/threonine-protein kinase 11-interacting protein isoform X2 [Denticeps clupeoides]